MTSGDWNSVLVTHFPGSFTIYVDKWLYVVERSLILLRSRLGHCPKIYLYNCVCPFVCVCMCVCPSRNASHKGKS